MAAIVDDQAETSAETDNLILVSSDTHIGPKLSQLREYCPADILDQFDAFKAEIDEVNQNEGVIPAEAREAMKHMNEEERAAIVATLQDEEGPLAQLLRNRRTPGHHDMPTRLQDMDDDGLAVDIIFHGSQNGEPIPFVTAHDLTAGLTTPFTFEGVDHELAEAGIHMYNESLADAVSLEPKRHVGLAHIPAWNPEKSVAEVHWAHEHGLKGVNMPAWRPGMPIWQDEAWEPFYAAVNDYQMPLTNHGGAGDEDAWPAGEGGALRFIESAYHSKRLIWTLLFHGTFEKYPDIRLVIAEIPGRWWPVLMEELDSIKGRASGPSASELCRKHVFHGATFISRTEAENAVDEDYWTNILWGSDYPHVEGTWQFPAPGETVPQTHLSLRDAFAGLDGDKVRAMCGLNAIDVYNLDREYLQGIANKISAPTAEYVSQPLDRSDVPANHGMFVFRTVGPWS